jgi:cell division protein FtsB
LGLSANAVWVDRVTAADRMSQVARRRVRTRRLIDSIVLMITLSAIAVCISVYFRTRAELEAALSKHKAASNRLNGLQIKTERLARDVERMKNDPRAIEEFARERLGYIRRGEVIVNVPRVVASPGRTESYSELATLPGQNKPTSSN